MLRLAIVGCGDIARYTAFFCRMHRRIRLAACCDISPGRAARFARRYQIARAFTDYEAMLSQVELDAVYLAVPHHLHAAMIAAAVARGRHVFVEKPVTRTLAEGQEMVQRAREVGVCVGVNYQYRYDAGCYALARAVQQGQLGTIRYARCNLPWCRDEAYFAGSSWHASHEAAGGGTLMTQGSHLLDVLLWALGKRPLRVQGVTARRKFTEPEVEDLAMGTIELEDGVLLQLCSSMAAEPEQALSIEIYGERGTAVYSNQPWPRVDFRGVTIVKEKPPHRGVHALQRSVEGFRAWVMKGTPYLTPAPAALPVLAVVEGLYRSAKTGCWETVREA